MIIDICQKTDMYFYGSVNKGGGVMARPQRNRKICSEPKYRCFAPVTINTDLEETEVSNSSSPQYDDGIVLSVDEYEAIRLIDWAGLTQEQCAKHMGVARTTVTEIYDKARHKIALMLIEGKDLKIDGGNYSVCNGSHPDGEALCTHCMSMLS